MASHKSVWILPCGEDREMLTPVIRELCDQYGCPFFEPHVTLFSCDIDGAKLAPVIDDLAGQWSPVVLSSASLASGPALKKTLYVQMHFSPELLRWKEQIEAHLPEVPRYHLDPHVSLVYQFLGADQREKICGSLDLQLKDYRFDRLQILDTGKGLPNPREIRNWRVLREYELTAL